MPRNDFINTDGTINYDNIPSTSQVANISIKQYGAKGDGTTDDFAAFLNSTLISKENIDLFIPAGDYRISNAWIITNKSVNIVGAGKGITRLIFDSGVDGIIYSSDKINRHFKLFNLSIYTKGTTGTGISATWPTIPSSTFETAEIEDIELQGYDMVDNINGLSTTMYWNKGLYINNGWHTKINRVHVRGNFNNVLASEGITLDGQSIDSRLSHCTVYFTNKCFNVLKSCEGMVIESCSGVFANYGVYTNSTGGGYVPPGITVSKCHFACFQYDIYIKDWAQSFITNNLLYRNIPAGFILPHIHIYINSTGSIHNIANNNIVGNLTDNNENGIVIENCQYTSISSNTVVLVSTPIWIKSTSSNNTITGNNLTNYSGSLAIQDDSNNNNIIKNNIPFTTETFVSAYRSGTNQTIPAATSTTVIFNTSLVDQTNNYNTSTGIFTAPKDGVYHFDVVIRLAAQAVGEVFTIILKRNASNYYLYDKIANQTDIKSISGGTTIKLSKNDTVQIQVIVTTQKDIIMGDTLTFFNAVQVIG